MNQSRNKDNTRYQIFARFTRILHPPIFPFSPLPPNFDAGATTFFQINMKVCDF